MNTKIIFDRCKPIVLALCVAVDEHQENNQDENQNNKLKGLKLTETKIQAICFYLTYTATHYDNLISKLDYVKHKNNPFSKTIHKAISSLVVYQYVKAIKSTNSRSISEAIFTSTKAGKELIQNAIKTQKTYQKYVETTKEILEIINNYSWNQFVKAIQHIEKTELKNYYTGKMKKDFPKNNVYMNITQMKEYLQESKYNM